MRLTWGLPGTGEGVVQGDVGGLQRLDDGGAVIEVDEDLALMQRRSLLDDPHGGAVVLIIVATARGSHTVER